MLIGVGSSVVFSSDLRYLVTQARWFLTGKVAPYKFGFGPFPADIHHARFPHAYHGVSVNDALDDIAHLLKYDIEPARVAAIIVEPVQGEGGFVVAPPE